MPVSHSTLIESETKTCSKCGELTPLDAFPFRDKAKGTRRNHCKTCEKAKMKTWNEKNKDRVQAQHQTPEFRAKQNARWRERYAANPEKHKAHSKKWWQENKEKALAANKAYYEANRERISERSKKYRDAHIEQIKTREKARVRTPEYEVQQRAYREANKEKIATYRREYYQANKLKFRERQRVWAAANREKINARQRELNKTEARREYYKRRDASIPIEKRKARYQKMKAEDYHRKYREANPEIIKRIERNHLRKRRALKANAPVVEKINEAMIIERDNSTCYLWCKRKLEPEEITLDHVIPLSRKGPHSDDNLRVACVSCNSRKRDKLLWELGLEDQAATK